MKARDKILKAAQDLFFEQGIKKVSIAEIYETAQVSKMSFYRQFKNKEDIVLHIFRSLYDTSMVEYNKIVDQKLSFRETLTQLTDLKVRFSRSMSKKFLEEFLQMFSTKSEVMEELQEMQKEGRALFVNEIMKAKATGEIREDLSIEFMLSMLDHMQTYIEDPRHIEMFSSSQEMVKEITNFYFFGIYGPKE
ncbi:TetR/AcrR family transcriptional regulator [Flammeovirga aprica]|uniref:TetR/AcrR family transcriptional regulator n=1 Tax=Flammeovirga aprica JL-4 TaxID=694437 RepID=A0A7X9XBF7_9BACT|nr:TetR/AcrR family transcriptional regulator [Flammeovirga aprica]NME70662.1 TetR/AcrR family transcriptional regulator [Flammeovirga aprica JL-4]